MANEGLDTARKGIELIELLSVISSRAVKQAGDVRAAKEAAEAQIEPTVKALIAGGCIPAELAKEAAEQLGDHANTLEILQNTAELLRKSGQHLGEPHGEGRAKQAGVADWNGRTARKRASDINFEQKVLGRTISA